ncbi:MAG: NAD(P)-dependent glycerol-3-phosphate dehydrogenase [Chitinophagales bacterium]|nr:NAD(P)-dependent glycerol-3-phosphate dehydrogenase [Chitinophagales bacterium]
MAYINTSHKKPVGVIGTGSFGTTIANLLAENGPVLLYSRRADKVDEINKTKMSAGQTLHNHITASNDIEEVCNNCNLIFPSVPSKHFRATLKSFSPYLKPEHFLVHTTKGLDIEDLQVETSLEIEPEFRLSDIKTMSQLIIQETNVRRVGCISGPNLAKELSQHQPAATVIASPFDEVIAKVRNSIKSQRFQVYASHDIFGVELAGVLKNSLAITAGALNGMGYGQNTVAFLLARGVREMMILGTALGAKKSAFFGIAGIGDIIATCTSPLSRNFSVGYRVAKGESLDNIISTSSEVAEGLRTVDICNRIANHLNLDVPIVKTTYKVLFEDWDTKEGLAFLMDYKNQFDVDFM